MPTIRKMWRFWSPTWCNNTLVKGALQSLPVRGKRGQCSMKKVSGSFTREALCTELIKEISFIKKLPRNVSETTGTPIEKSQRASVKPERKYKQLYNKLMVRNWIIEQGCLVQGIFPWAFYDFIKSVIKSAGLTIPEKLSVVSMVCWVFSEQ